MQKLHKTLYATVIASESMHIFCCVLPTIFSIVSLLAGFGMVAAMPAFVEHAHEVLHSYEVPMIILSGAILLLGWGVYAYSRKLDCRTEGSCCHTPCEPKKDRTKLFMTGATILFFVNVTVYFVFHRGMDMDEHFHVHETHAMIGNDEHDH